MTKLHKFLLLGIPIFLFTVLLGLSASTDVLAEDATCVFVSQEGDAWVVRQDSSVKSTLKVGDPIFSGDQLFVTHGNTIQLAFDKQGQNIVQIEGNSNVSVTGKGPAEINLTQGKLFALLDKKGSASNFKIFTPTAVAAVRGTHFQVGYLDNISTVATYQGAVEVAARDMKGNIMPGAVMVNPGMKTQVMKMGEAPKEAIAMTQSEMDEITPVMVNVSKAKDFMGNQSDEWFDSQAKNKEEASGLVKAHKEEKKAEKGYVVI